MRPTVSPCRYVTAWRAPGRWAPTCLLGSDHHIFCACRAGRRGGRLLALSLQASGGPACVLGSCCVLRGLWGRGRGRGRVGQADGARLCLFGGFNPWRRPRSPCLLQASWFTGLGFGLRGCFASLTVSGPMARRRRRRSAPR